MATAPLLFGCVIAGRPLITEFTFIDNVKCATDIIAPSSVNELTVFIFPNNLTTSSIPPGYIAMLYYAPPPFVNWTIIGCIQTDKPSGIFYTGWKYCYRVIMLY